VALASVAVCGRSFTDHSVRAGRVRAEISNVPVVMDKELGGKIELARKHVYAVHA